MDHAIIKGWTLTAVEKIVSRVKNYNYASLIIVASGCLLQADAELKQLFRMNFTPPRAPSWSPILVLSWPNVAQLL